ncbi:MAG: DUF2339 domain-containing protein [Bryobacteraceae bacterium]
MDEGGVIALIGLLLIVLIGLPIIAIVRTRGIRALERRVAGVEAALLRLTRERMATEPAPPEVVEPVPAAPAPPAPEVALPIPAAPAPPATPAAPAPAPEIEETEEHLDQVIGRKWLGWVAILLIFGATAYFFKYAFENGWIGELGRVMLGVAASLALVWLGHDRYRQHWRYLWQILTGGGIAILYLSIYGAFGYYHLIDQRGAFIFLAIIVAEAFLLAAAYGAPTIAVMALVGGFLVPILLSTGRDQYGTLFTYIVLLDLGMLGVVIGRSWRWLGSLAYVGTQWLFWSWYSEHYHLEKRPAVLLFQTAIFLLFILADLAPHLRRRTAGWEEWVRLAVNPFVFYATCYALLNDDRHDWMAALALLLAVVYAAVARAELTLRPSDRRIFLVTLGTALTFVTIAIPVQLESNWITIAWAVEAVALLWAGLDTGAPPLRALSSMVFALAVGRFLFEDTPGGSRAAFTPVFNRYFLGMLALTACLAAAAYLYGRARPRAALLAGLVAFAVLWIGSSVEAFTYFSGQVAAIAYSTFQENGETIRHLRWAGQLSLSLLWSAYAGLFTVAGFRFRLRALRSTGLVVFGVTLTKVVSVDIPELRQFYRIVALLALGLVLLGAAWIYQRGLRREQTR